MNTSEIRDRLVNYVLHAEERKVQALYTLMEEEIDSTDDIWEDEQFIAELERRCTELRSGKLSVAEA